MLNELIKGMKKQEFKVLDTFTGTIGEYKVIETEDNTKTLWSEKFDETCHSTAGAYEETLYNYVQGCNIIERTKQHSPLVIFEVGFGLGVGLQATINEIVKNEIETSIHFISTELDPSLIEWSKQNLELNDGTLNLLEGLRLHEKNGITFYEVESENIKVTVLIGDARETVQKAWQRNQFSKVHCIYQDAFSPKRNPSLWTVEWFSLLKEISHEKAIMTTYSSSSAIKKSMVESGWIISKFPGFGPKKQATKACLTGTIKPEILEGLSRSPLTALTDDQVAEFQKI